MTLLDEMAADANATAKVPNDKLGRLSNLVHVMRDMEKELEAAEEHIKGLKEALRDVSEKKIPDLFDEIGLSELKLETGEKVSVKREFVGNITEANADAAFNWLEKNGHGSIIKHDVTVAIKMGEAEEYKKLLDELNTKGLSFKDKTYVHPQTLKSFVNEQMKTPDSDIPKDVFGIFPVRKTKLS